MQKTFTDTGRTALFGDGHQERVFETFLTSGPFAGATYEVLESELPEDAVFEKGRYEPEDDTMPCGCASGSCYCDDETTTDNPLGMWGRSSGYAPHLRHEYESDEATGLAGHPDGNGERW